MHLTKVSSFTLAVISVSLFLSNPLHSARQLESGSMPILRADGGAPVPPVPPKGKNIVSADAGVEILQADGGAPVPPVPPKGKTVVSVGATITYLSDGGMEILQADGGAPVPPVPPKGKTIVSAEVEV
jgi:hypothetical protein